MTENRVGLIIFMLFLVGSAVALNLRYWRERANVTFTPNDLLEQQIVADLSNLPPHIGDPKAPIVIRVTVDPKHGGPCTKGTVELVRQLAREHEGKVQAYFNKVSHKVKGECAAELTINGKKTFTITVNNKPMTIMLHGIARPGDPMSFYIRQIVEQEIEMTSQKKEVSEAEGISRATKTQSPKRKAIVVKTKQP